eukprot:COSAG02_NODE_3716_length_6329_cov_11.179133_4_plen_147_part_00
MHFIMLRCRLLHCSRRLPEAVLVGSGIRLSASGTARFDEHFRLSVLECRYVQRGSYDSCVRATSKGHSPSCRILQPASRQRLDRAAAPQPAYSHHEPSALWMDSIVIRLIQVCWWVSPAQEGLHCLFFSVHRRCVKRGPAVFASTR